MSLQIQPLIWGIDQNTEEAQTLEREFQEDKADLLADLEFLPLKSAVGQSPEQIMSPLLVIASDLEVLKKGLESLSPPQLRRTVLYGQSGQTRDELLMLPVAGVIPDRTIAEARRISRIPGYQPTRLMLVGYGLYGRKGLFDPRWFDREPLNFTDEGDHGLFVLADEQRKFDLGLTLRHFTECLPTTLP